MVLSFAVTLIASCAPGEHRALLLQSVREDAINYAFPELRAGVPWWILLTYAASTGLHEHISVVLRNTGSYPCRGRMTSGSDFTIKPGGSVELFEGSLEGWMSLTRSIETTTKIISDSGPFQGILAVHTTNAPSLGNRLNISAYTAP
jgi:hypothetical protein